MAYSRQHGRKKNPWTYLSLWMRISSFNDLIQTSQKENIPICNKKIEKLKEPTTVEEVIVIVKESIKISKSTIRFIGHIRQAVNESIPSEEEFIFYAKLPENVKISNIVRIVILRYFGPKLIICNIHGCL